MSDSVRSGKTVKLIRIVTRLILGKAPKDVRFTEFLLSKGLIDRNTYYDILTESVMQRVITPASVCIDVGCYKGSILRLMMKYAPAGRFLAFEPLPHLYKKILEKFNSDAVRVHNLALSDSAGTSSFNGVESNPAYSGLKKRRYDRPNETDSQIEVKVDTLDNILGKEPVGKVSFIKIDVEGAEYFVMKGAEKCIKRDRPVIVFEHGMGGSDCYGMKPEDVYELLHDRCGLRISLLSDYLLRKSPLDREGFCDQFYKGKHYFFIAY